MKKKTCIITNLPDCDRSDDDVLHFSNAQWTADPNRLEGCEFDEVIIRCHIIGGLQAWLHMMLGIRIGRIVYEGPR